MRITKESEQRTKKGGTDTTEGFLPHLKIGFLLEAPVCVLPYSDRSKLPRPIKDGHGYVYALPDGGRISA